MLQEVHIIIVSEAQGPAKTSSFGDHYQNKAKLS